MPGVNTFPWDRIEGHIWNHFYKGIITEAEAWEGLVHYWVMKALRADFMETGKPYVMPNM